METISHNKLIAEFMGGKLNGESTIRLAHNDIWLPKHGICRYDTIDTGKGKTIHYHDSFDWIMPVVEKIEQLEIVDQFSITYDSVSKTITVEIWPSFNNSFDYIRTYTNTIIHNDPKLLCIYNACIEFIQWHNEHFKSSGND